MVQIVQIVQMVEAEVLQRMLEEVGSTKTKSLL